MDYVKFRKKGTKEPFRKFLISNYRRKHNLSMDEFAKLLGVSLSAVWCWETGKTQPRKEGLRLLNKLLDRESATESSL